MTQDAARRRGRRPAGEDLRGAILEAARSEFAEHGFDRTTLRGVASAAGVDARLVHHYFDGKEDLFIASMQLPFRPQDVLPQVLAGDPDGLGERFLRMFLGVWESPPGRERVVGLVGAVITNPAVSRMLREFLAQEVFGRIAASLRVPDPQLRASLAASQMVGLIVTRYVVQLEPIASVPAEELVPLIAPTLQRYLTDPDLR